MSFIICFLDIVGGGEKSGFQPNLLYAGWDRLNTEYRQLRVLCKECALLAYKTFYAARRPDQKYSFTKIRKTFTLLFLRSISAKFGFVKVNV